VGPRPEPVQNPLRTLTEPRPELFQLDDPLPITQSRTHTHFSSQKVKKKYGQGVFAIFARGTIRSDRGKSRKCSIRLQREMGDLLGQ
jgi:hypothetical protein